MYIPYLAYIYTPYLFLSYYDILFNLIYIQPKNIPPSSPSSSLLGSSRKTRIKSSRGNSSPTSPSPTHPFPLILRPRGPLGEKKQEKSQVSPTRALLPLPIYPFPLPTHAPEAKTKSSLFFFSPLREPYFSFLQYIPFSLIPARALTSPFPTLSPCPPRNLS